MPLTDFRPQFDNAYQEIFLKVLVGKEICNTRFQALLKYGESVERVAYDISAVRVRDVVRGSASTIDAITDTSETLTVNLDKEAVFHISDGEVTQAGPLNPGEVIGGKIALKVAADLDARIFAEVLNAANTFDEGDLTTLASTGTPITQSSTTVPQMVTRMPAKLKAKENQTLTNMALVIDAYAAADIAQYLLGKQFDIVESVFKNGYAGTVSTATVYISENLTGSAVFTDAGLADGETLTINGILFTAKTTLGTDPGNFALGADNTAALANLVALVNAPGTTNSTQRALSAADQVKITDTFKITAEVVTAASVIRITGRGAGRLTVAETAGSGAWTLNTLHCYYGKKGAIDLVLQDVSPVDMRPTDDRRGTNVFSSYLGALKVFADGAKQYLNLKIAA